MKGELCQLSYRRAHIARPRCLKAGNSEGRTHRTTSVARLQERRLEQARQTKNPELVTGSASPHQRNASQSRCAAHSLPQRAASPWLPGSLPGHSARTTVPHQLPTDILTLRQPLALLHPVPCASPSLRPLSLWRTVSFTSSVFSSVTFTTTTCGPHRQGQPAWCNRSWSRAASASSLQLPLTVFLPSVCM